MMSPPTETVEFEPPGSDSDEDENDNEEESDDEGMPPLIAKISQHNL